MYKKYLYATFLSYQPKEKFTYELEKYIDQRGEFSEFIRTKNSGQISFFTINKGFTRGNHYHHTKNEKNHYHHTKNFFLFKVKLNLKCLIFFLMKDFL